MRLALISLLLLASCTVREEPSCPTYHYEVDLELARALGGLAPDASEDEVTDALVDRVGARLLSLGPWTGLYLAIDPPGQLIVTIDQVLTPEEQRIVDASLRSLGGVEFCVVAESFDAFDPLTDLATERQRMEMWVKENPAGTVEGYSLVPHDEGGPHPQLLVCRRRPRDDFEAPDPFEYAEFLLRPRGLRESFTGADFDSVSEALDTMGYPALGFEFSDDRKADFEAYTARFTGRNMAIVIRGEVLSSPQIGEALPGAGIIHGQFSQDEIGDLMRMLESDTHDGPLRLLSIGK